MIQCLVFSMTVHTTFIYLLKYLKVFTLAYPTEHNISNHILGIGLVSKRFNCLSKLKHSVLNNLIVSLSNCGFYMYLN